MLCACYANIRLSVSEDLRCCSIMRFSWRELFRSDHKATVEEGPWVERDVYFLARGSGFRQIALLPDLDDL